MAGKLKLFFSIVALLVCCFLTNSSTSSKAPSSRSYSVLNVYESVDIPDGTKALDSWGNLKEIKDLFVRTEMDTGKYTVEVTRIDSNFYRICGTDLYVETQFCYEYATREEVVLNISSKYGYTKGEVVFF